MRPLVILGNAQQLQEAAQADQVRPGGADMVEDAPAELLRDGQPAPLHDDRGDAGLLGADQAERLRVAGNDLDHVAGIRPSAAWSRRFCRVVPPPLSSTASFNPPPITI